jgi:oligoendopeptidase F
VDALVEAVSSRNDISHRFYKLKAKLLGVKKLKYYEKTLSVSEMTEKFPKDKTIEIVSETFKNLDDEFSKIFDGFLANGQVDFFPKKGKMSGAFCAHNSITQPTYILLNHTDRMEDVLTLAHEVGHGINNELIKKVQNPINFGTPTSVAEIASTFMEDFALERIMKSASKKEKLALMMFKLNEDVSTIFRQVACYKLEQRLHEEYRKIGYVSKDKVGEIFVQSMSEYLGESVEMEKGSENFWIYWGHIRRLFYVYSYASGLLISKYLQGQVRKDKKNIEKAKYLFSVGMSEAPEVSLKKLGVDISKPEIWEDGIKEIETLLDECEKLATDQID